MQVFADEGCLRVLDAPDQGSQDAAEPALVGEQVRQAPDLVLRRFSRRNCSSCPCFPFS